MKTEDILNIDCRKEEGKHKVNSFLWKIKPITKLNIPKGCIIEVEDLEKVLHGICDRYGYEPQWYQPYRENGKFKFWMTGMLKTGNGTREWIGNVYGVTLWEITAKCIIKIYGEILKERKANT